MLEGFIADEIKTDVQNLFGSGFLSRGGFNVTTSINATLQKRSNDLLISELTKLDVKNNRFKPTVFNINIKDYDKSDWENFFRDNNKKNNNIWDLGVIVNNNNGKYLLKTDKSNVLLDLNFQYEKSPVFKIGDIVYYKFHKNKKKIIYKQIDRKSVV